MQSAHSSSGRFVRLLVIASIIAVVAMLFGARVDARAASDDDAWKIQPAMHVSPLSGSELPTTLTERGAGARVRIHLSSRPSAPVDVLFLSDGQVAADLPRRTLLPEQWSSGLEVTIAAVPDGALEGSHRGTLRLATRSLDPDYDGLAVEPLSFDIADADHAGVTIQPDPVEIAEGDGATPVRVRLSAMPSANVLVQLHADPAQFELDRLTLTFTPGNWNVEQIVSAIAIDDDVHEAPSTGTFITTTTSSTSAVFNQIVVPPTSVRVYDDDSAGVDVDAPSPIQLDEARATNGTEMGIRLKSRPSANVTLTLTEAAGQVRLSATRLTFTASNWRAVQRVTVSAVDDAIVELRPHAATITMSTASQDADYGSSLRIASRAVQIQDDDVIGVELTGIRDWPTSVVTPDRQDVQPVPLDEGGATGKVRMRFASAPSHDLTISPVVAPLGQVRVTPASITIKAGTTLPSGADFDVVAVNDNIDEADPHSATIAWELATSDTNYAGLATIRTNVAIGDDDTAGVRVAPSGVFDTVEGGPQRELTVTLASAPTARVVINVLADSQTTAVAKTTSLRFDAQTWNVPQTVAIAARDDDAAELSPHSGLVAFDVASTDPNYDDLPVAPIEVRIRDNDVSGVLVTSTGADTRVVEGGQNDIVNVRLRSRPLAAVTVKLTDASRQVAFPSGSSVTIEPAAWSRAHEIVVAAVQDDALQGTRTVHLDATVQSTDPSYASGAGALPQPLDVTVIDDERPGIVIEQSGGDTSVTEAGGNDSYTVALASQPSADVTVTAAGDAQVGVTPSSLTFTSSNWKSPQELVVRAVQDDIDEPEHHVGTIRHSVRTTAAGWDLAVKLPDVGVRVLDDDSSSIRFSATGGSTRVVEGGASDTVTMVLTSRPSAPVEILAKPDEQITVEGTLAFGPDDWQQPRTLTIRAVDDESVTGERVAAVGFVVRSADALYRVQRIPPLDVIVVDNDVWADDERGTDEDGDEDDRGSRGASGAPTPPVPAADPGANASERGANHGGVNPGTGGDSSLRATANGASASADAAPVTGEGLTLGAGAASDDAAAGELTASRNQPGRGDGRTKRSNANALGRWARDHIGLLAIAGGLLGMTGIGGGWLALRNPTRMARHAGRGFDSDRLLP